MTVSVDIEVARSPGALALSRPTRCTTRRRRAVGAARWKADGAGAPAAVKLGLRGTAGSRFARGLAPGDRVVPAAALDPAGPARVRGACRMRDWLPFEWIVAFRFMREGRMQTVSIMVGVSIGVRRDHLHVGRARRAAGQRRAAHAHLAAAHRDPAARGGGAPAARRRRRRPRSCRSPLAALRSIDQWQKIVEELRARARWPRSRRSSPGPAFAVRGDASRARSTITGIEPESYFRIVPLPEKDRRRPPRLGAHDIVIGTELGKDLGVGGRRQADAARRLGRWPRPSPCRASSTSATRA